MKIQVDTLKRITLTLILNLLLISFTYSQQNILNVGAARVDITPPVNQTNSSGNFDHEQLYVRAIFLDNGKTQAVLVGADLAILSDDVWSKVGSQIKEKFNIPVENIIISATHTHSGGAQSGPSKGMMPDTGKTTEAIMEAVIKAETTLQPAQVGFGTGEAYLNVNRDVIDKKTRLWTQAANLEGPSDKTLAVVMFTDMSGMPIAGYMNYAMHPVNAWLAGFTTADFPGAASRYIENAFNDDMVLIFSQGASGDQNPLYLRTGTNVMASRMDAKIEGYEMNREDVEALLRDIRDSGEPMGITDPKIGSALERYIDALGVILGEEAIRIMSNINNFNDDIRIWGIQDILTVPGRVRTNTELGREGVPGTFKESDPVNIRLGFLGIGDIAFTTVNAEIYNIIGQQVKEGSPMAKTIVVTLCNGSAASGYIIDDASYGRQTFQVLRCRLQPGYAEKGIVNGLVKMVEQYMDNISN